MGHLEFEQLLFERDPLPDGDRERLETHLQECMHCSQLKDRWVAVESLLRTAPSIPAPQGFTARFQARLDRGRLRRRARLVFLITTLTGVGLIAILGLLGWTLISSGATIFTWVLKVFNQFYWIGTFIDVLVETGIQFLEYLIEQLPLLTWMVISAAISVLSLTWITSFYRFNHRAIRRE